MQVSDGSGSTSWTYTTSGRVASRTQAMGVSKTVGYGYNGVGQLETLTTPSGQVIAYGYSNNRVSSITVNSTTLLEDVIYDPFGPARQWTWGNSTLTAREFDQDGLIDEVDSAGLRTYAQDDAFRITGITDTVNSALSWSYGYNSLDRLTTANKTGQSQTWTYDSNGNRLTQGGTSSSTYTISSSSNRLSSISGALSRTYGYDSSGNTTSYGGYSFTYNDAGRMTGVSGSASATYTQNALGQRVKKGTGGATTYFAYDEVGHLIGEYDGSGNLIQETVWLGDTPVATLRPNGGSVSIFYVHVDHLNTPRRITRPSDGAIVWRWDSDPFGTDAPNQDPDGDTNQFTYNLRFPGQYFDAETGLSYNYFRDYDPATGRYPQSDPIGLAGSISTYGYVSANPISFVDPFGLQERGAGMPSPGEIQEMRERECARRAFFTNKAIMEAVNVQNSDHYFHCKANCEAARCGPAGRDEACLISQAREFTDINFKDPFKRLLGIRKGTPRDRAASIRDAQSDVAANTHGRTQALQQPGLSCSAVCSIFRPNGLDPKY
jgi:RHS repeat-associated protein